MRRRPTTSRPRTAAAPPEIAAARLAFTTDADPGISRRRAGRGFAYRRPDGSPVTDRATLERIRALAIPPAYTAVWICLRPEGHLQATGRDARGRRQYRYHPRWREVRDATKFARMAAFGRALPAIRARVEADLALRGPSRERVLAAVVRLLDTTFQRIGNERYAEENGSYGLTTLRKRHAEVDGGSIALEFRAKSGRMQHAGVTDRRLARAVRSCQEIPGQRLFQYLDGAGERHPVRSDDVNAYIEEAAGEGFTAKDFRTWAGTRLAAEILRREARPQSDSAAGRAVAACIKAVAEVLGNTPTVCRKCYIHPGVPAAFLSGALERALADAGDEGWMLRLLEGRPAPRAGRALPATGRREAAAPCRGAAP